MNNLDNLLMLNYSDVYGYLALIFKAGHDPSEKVDPKQAVMNKRRSHTTTIIAMMQVILLITGLVSPGWIWCYEGDGRTAFEFGGDCSGISILGPAADRESLSNLTGQCCVSCVDSPVFVVEVRGDVFSSALALILDTVSVESVLGSQYEILALHLGTYLTPDISQTYLSLYKPNSVILLI